MSPRQHGFPLHWNQSWNMQVASLGSTLLWSPELPWWFQFLHLVEQMWPRPGNRHLSLLPGRKEVGNTWLSYRWHPGDKYLHNSRLCHDVWWTRRNFWYERGDVSLISSASLSSSTESFSGASSQMSLYLRKKYLSLGFCSCHSFILASALVWSQLENLLFTIARYMWL